MQPKNQHITKEREPGSVHWLDFHRFWSQKLPTEAWRRNFYFRWREFPEVVRALSPKPGQRLLEVGSAWISTTPLLLIKQFDCSVTCVDHAPLDDAIRQRMKTQLNSLGFSKSQREALVLHQSDAAQMDLEPESFDAAYAISTLEHFPDTDDSVTISKMAAAIKPGGKLVVSVPFVFGPPMEDDISEGPEHRQRWYNMETLFERLVAPSGLRLKNMRYVTETRPALGQVFRRLSTRGRRFFSMTLLRFSKTLWKVALELDADDVEKIDPFRPPLGILADRGAMVVTLEKCTPPAPKVKVPGPNLVKRSYLPEKKYGDILPFRQTVESTNPVEPKLATSWADVKKFFRPLPYRRWKMNRLDKWAITPAVIDAAMQNPEGPVLFWTTDWCELAPYYLAMKKNRAVDLLCDRTMTGHEQAGAHIMARKLGLTGDQAQRLAFIENATLLANENPGYASLVCLDVLETLSEEDEKALSASLNPLLASGGKALIAVPFLFGAHVEFANPSGTLRRIYNRDTLFERIIHPSKLSITRARFFGERLPRFGQMLTKLPAPLAMAISSIASRRAKDFWRTYVDTDASGFFDLRTKELPQGVPLDTGMLLLEMTKQGEGHNADELERAHRIPRHDRFVQFNRFHGKLRDHNVSEVPPAKTDIIEIQSVSVLDGEGNPKTEFRVHEQINIEVSFIAKKPVVNPLVRITLHDPDDMFVFGTNTYRHGIDLGTVEGTRTVRLTIDRPCVHHGRYLLTVGIWPREFADPDPPVPFDEHYRAYELTVTSGRADGDGVVAMDHSWKIDKS